MENSLQFYKIGLLNFVTIAIINSVAIGGFGPITLSDYNFAD